MNTLSDLISKYLVCPKNFDSLILEGDQIVSRTKQKKGYIHSNVALMFETPPQSYFDDKFDTMLAGHSKNDGDWKFAYEKQVELIELNMPRGGIAVDIGCGPGTPYPKPLDTFLIGLEYSFPSIAANQAVDLRVCASAEALPFASCSVDLIIAVYAVHHITGLSVNETTMKVTQVLSEFARVVRTGGKIIIIEMAPFPLLSILQSFFWNIAKNFLGDKLDQFFWTPQLLKSRCPAEIWNLPLRILKFNSSPFEFVPPIFSLPWLRIPRFLYPLRSVAYIWQA